MVSERDKANERHQIAEAWGQKTRRTRRTALLVPPAIGALALLYGASDAYALAIAYSAAYYVVLAQSWNLASGLTGYISLGHAAGLGVGGYVAILAVNAGWPISSSLVMAAVAAGVVGAGILGSAAMRVGGLTFALVTLFLLEAAKHAVASLETVTRGSLGLFSSELLTPDVATRSMVGIAVIITVILGLLRTTKWGLGALALREEELAAVSLGLNATSRKIGLFGASWFLVGLMGGIHGLFVGQVYPTTAFSLETTVVALALALIGRMGSWFGPAIVGVAYAVLRELVRVQLPEAHLVVLGLAIVLVMRIAPPGKRMSVQHMWRRMARESARSEP